ncbi:MAG: hypothetical protein F6K65_33800 [Moorea sp. SIO3C2]|nr:hypothetical protein [Moorena sp. SIO3C2]
MERWRDGEMERWRDGEMERWGDGEMEIEIEISKGCRFADQRLHRYSLFPVPFFILSILY